MKRMLSAGAVAAMLGGCDNDTLAPSDVVGATWSLVSLQVAGGSPVAVENPLRYTVQFSSEGRLLVRSDCNSCGGSYSLSDSSVEVGPLACTKAFCGDASLDAPFTSALQRARSVAVNDRELTIEGGGGTLRFTK